MPSTFSLHRSRLSIPFALSPLSHHVFADGVSPLRAAALEEGRLPMRWVPSEPMGLAGAGEGEVARSQRTPPAHAASSVVSPRSSPHARRRGELREVLEDRSRVRSYRGSRSSDRGARKDRRARSQSDSSRDRGRRSRSCSSYRLRSIGHPLGCCPPASDRDLRISPALDACALILGETGLDPRIDTVFAVTGRSPLTTTDHVDSVCVPCSPGSSQ